MWEQRGNPVTFFREVQAPRTGLFGFRPEKRRRIALPERIQIADYDPRWPEQFQREAERVRAALGPRALRLEHTGSTSVPGLAAKPIIDMLLVVADSADEPAYVPALAHSGYTLKIREPEWFEHRMFKGPDTDVNLHVFSSGCSEIARTLSFRDWLRASPADRELYERTKRALSLREWKNLQEYADAKTAVVEEILARARAAL
ncbi:MAG TPA: GrpB family protein [Patescibacteria group bacterium]|nr:GrpB family protein [Patescibacteria group bacterium]